MNSLPTNYDLKEIDQVFFIYSRANRDFVKEQQIVRYLVKYSKFFQTPISFYAIQIINPFLNSIMSANCEKGLSPNAMV